MLSKKCISEIAVTLALTVVCSLIKLWEMPQGGSVALTMLPLLLLSYRRGPLSGLLCGALYGVFAILLSGAIYHPLSILLDYILAFGLLGLAGFFPKSFGGILFGTTVGVGARFVSSLISGAVLFANYAPQGQNPWLYSLIYQATYMLPEFLISVTILLLLFYKSKALFSPKSL